MRIQKFICEHWRCRNKGRVWYCSNTPRKEHRSEVGRRLCPTCGKGMKCKAIQKSIPKGGSSLNSTLTERASGNYDRRPGDRNLLKLKEKMEGDRIRIKNYVRSQNVVKMYDEGDEDNDVLGLEQAQQDDDDYAPPPQFNPNMRLTTGHRTCRLVFDDSPQYFKSTAKIWVSASKERVDKSTNQNYVMGTLLKGAGSFSAWQYLGRPSYALDRFNSAEWCHLIADCLGGATTPDNLVAASFAANTEMLAIENLLMGKTWARVMVHAYCSGLHKAESIHYHVYCKRGDSWKRPIDGRNNFFSKADLEELQSDLKDFLTTHKSCRK